jgi:glycosyltransferase involved in cell wall biosynthesis
MNEYTRKLVQNDVDVTVIAARHSRDVPATEEIDGVSVHRILTDSDSAVSIKPTLFGYRALKHLDTLCSKSEIDILHLISFPNLGVVLAPIPWFESPPVVVADTRSTAVRNALFDAISRWGICLQDWLVDQSIVIDERVGANVLGSDATFDVVPLGVDTDAFTPGDGTEKRRSWGISRDDLVIGYTGSLHKPRQIDRAIDAFGEVHTEHPEAKFVIVGDGMDRESLERHTRRKTYSDDVHFIGEVEFSEMPQCLRAFDVGFAYVPDRPQYRDQPPLKTVEFLASGLPIVATDTPGNRVFADHGENALVVEDKISAYTDSLRRIVESAQLRHRLSENARESVTEYDYNHIVKNRLIPIYERLVSTGRKSGY